MSGRTRIALAAVVAALSLAVAVAPASATGPIDQQQTSIGFYTSIWGPTFALAPPATGKAQTFTAGRSGELDQVDLHLRTYAETSGPLRVEIRNVTADTPGSTVLASATVPAANVPIGGDGAAFVAVPFASPATVLKDSQYAIVAEADGSDIYEWSGDQNTSYTGGRALYSEVPPGDNWAPFATDFDFAFKTYVTTPTADLSVSITGPATAKSKASVTYLLTVQNAGPSAATNVVLTDNLPFGTQFSSVPPSQGTCTLPGKKGTTISCQLGDVANGGNSTSGVTLKVTAKAPANLSSVATVASDVLDPNTSNNTASFTTKITK
jgi:uncharacterized repeat protein (TIGR01451 family)